MSNNFIHKNRKIYTKVLLINFILLLSFIIVKGEFLYLEKTEFTIGETVSIITQGPLETASLEILSPSNIYRYLGVPQTELKFVPKEIGNYEIRLSDQNGIVLQSLFFTVSDITSATDLNFTLTEKEQPTILIKNSFNQELITDYLIYNQSEEIIFSSETLGAFETTETLSSLIFSQQKYDLELIMNRTSVKNMIFYNITFDQTFELGFEEMPNESVSNYFLSNERIRRIDKVYAIDPTKIKFDSAVITFIASGNELYKCKDYNFTNRTCYGEHVKIMDMIPGMEYNFTLTPEDPQYTETTSNTAGCSCTNTCTTGTGGASSCTASCNDYCDINFTIPSGAISGWLEKVSYSVTVTLSGTGTSVSALHEGRLDKDEIINSGNDVQIGTSTISTKATNNIVFENINMPDPYVSTSFDETNCTWSNGYCTWKPFLSSSYTCTGNRRTCITTISLTLINYTWNYTVDTINPTISFGNPANNSFINTNSNLFFYTPNDNLDLKNCSIYLNGVLNQTNTTLTKGAETTLYVTNMNDGYYSWYILCYDTNLNSNTSGTRYLTIDTIAPSVSYIWPTPYNQSYLQVNYLVVNVSHIESNPDKLIFNWNKSITTQPYTGSFTNISKIGLSEGLYYYNLSINDSASNTNATGTYWVVIDTINPQVSLNEPLNNNWINYNTSIRFNFTPTDTNIQNCTLYGNFTGTGLFEKNETNLNPVSGIKNNFNTINIKDGIYVWNVLCYDKSGRSAWAISNYTLKVDASIPLVTLLEPYNNTLWNESSTVMFNYTVTDSSNIINNCTLEVKSNITTLYFEDTSIETVIKQNFTVELSNNKFNWTILCTDVAGNTNSIYPGYYNLTVAVGEDTVGPNIVLESPQNSNWTNINNITLIYTPTDNSLINNCSLYVNDVYNQTDIEVENEVSNFFVLNKTKEGIYSWYINCTDNSTNKNNRKSQDTWTFIVDQSNPSLYLVSPINFFNTTNLNINFTWLLIDLFSQNMYCDLIVNNSLEASLKLTQNNTYTNQTAYLTNDGVYYWNVTCRDEAYNYNVSQTRAFTIDSTIPYIDLILPENGNTSTTGDITFYHIPSDNTSGLNNCILYLNGLEENSSFVLLNNQQNNFTKINLVSGNYNWQVNCTDKLGNKGYSETRTFSVDNIAPKTNSYQAIPTTADLSQSVNIFVNVTDNSGLNIVIAQIMKPSGATTNYTMTLYSTDIYNLTYIDTTERGTYTVNIFSNDTYGNLNISKNYYFYVSAGIFVNKIYFDRGETVYITGGGFDPGDNITLNITDKYGITALNSPIKDIIVNSTGGFATTWNISTANGQATGNYTILGYDVNSPGQAGTNYAYLVRRLTAANLDDKNTAGLVVNSLVNESDTQYSTIVPGAGIDLLNFTWVNIVPDNQVISDVRFYMQHYETAQYNVYLEWYNSSNGVWTRVCTILTTATEKIDTCDLNDEVKTSSEANYLQLRLTDNNGLGASTGNWVNLNFAYLEVTFTTLTLDKESYVQGEKVNISGSRWPVNTELTLNISKTDSTTDQQTTTTDANGNFNSIYNISYGAPLGRFNITVFVTTNPDDTEETYFYVVKRNSSIATDKLYYGRAETVNITGRGFSPDANITILIYDAQNFLRLNTSVISDNIPNGTMEYLWSIPYAYSGYYGKHTIIVNDKLYPNLNGTANITVGILTTNSTKLENSILSDETSKVNQSDNITASLAVYNGVEDYMSFNFLDASTSNYVLSNFTFYIQHNEVQNYDLVLEWWNDTSWVDVCRITYSIDKKIDSCDLLPLIERTPRTANLTLKITDNQSNLGVSGNIWTYIDYVYLVSWADPDFINPKVNIYSPSIDSIYNYSQSVPIVVNISENVEIDTVYALLEWSSGSEIILLTPLNINYFGEGIYEGFFTNTKQLDYFNVTIFANDTTGNYNDTEKTNFSIQSPDLTSNSSYIFFSNENPVENENITLNITLFNRGNYVAGQFTVRFFEGDYTFEKQIGEDIIISSLNSGENITIETTWLSKVGTHIIQIVIDPPLETNGSVWEINESNNVVEGYINIPSWNIFYGNTSGYVKLEKDTSEKKFSWNITTGGNMYVVETGTEVDWSNLQALGRDIFNQVSYNDFFEADVALQMENNTDSLNRTYVINNLPLYINDIIIYTNQINNVPFINSTNTSNFMTGILWDKSEGNTEYNGTQDLIFITQVNKEQQGKYGIQDYEIRVPYTLDTYKMGSGTVTFYTEII